MRRPCLLASIPPLTVANQNISATSSPTCFSGATSSLLQRGPEGGGRALAHYTVARPSVEDLQREVTEFVNSPDAKSPNALLAERAGVTNAHDTRKEP